MAGRVPGQVVPHDEFNSRARTPTEDLTWWKQQLLEEQLANAAALGRNKGSGGRRQNGAGSSSRGHRRGIQYDDESGSGSGDDDDNLDDEDADEMVRLREELRAAAGSLKLVSRERSLRRALRDTGLAPLPSRSRANDTRVHHP